MISSVEKVRARSLNRSHVELATERPPKARTPLPVLNLLADRDTDELLPFIRLCDVMSIIGFPHLGL